VTFGDFYVMFQRENHFINKRIQKPRRLNMKCIPAVNSVNKTNKIANKPRRAQPIRLVTFWGKIALKRFKNHQKSSRN
jgi:hypothetical protein